MENKEWKKEKISVMMQVRKIDIRDVIEGKMEKVQIVLYRNEKEKSLKSIEWAVRNKWKSNVKYMIGKELIRREAEKKKIDKKKSDMEKLQEIVGMNI